MLNVSGVAINFDGQNLFSNVNLQFLPGNCYGIIGANGAGKSTFLRILSGDLEPSKGEISFDPKYRMSVLKQDHFAYEEQSIFETIMQGNARLYRQGQSQPVIIHRLLVKDAADELVAKALQSKSASQQGLIEGIKALAAKAQGRSL